MPYSIPVEASSMNYASVVWAGYVASKALRLCVSLTLSRSFAAISIAWYFIRGRKDFKGPPVQADADPTINGAVLEGSERELAVDTEAQTTAKAQ